MKTSFQTLNNATYCAQKLTNARNLVNIANDFTLNQSDFEKKLNALIEELNDLIEECEMERDLIYECQSLRLKFCY